MTFAPSRRVSAGLVVLLAATALVGPSAGPTVAAPTAHTTSATVAAARTGHNPPTPGNFTGKAFDQCSAPSQHAMNAWRRHSPYRGVGIYISGSVRACAKQRHLTPRWVRTQLAHGWKLLPIHVGRQASCNHNTDRAHRISARPAHGYSRARAQARAEANAAVIAARRFGLPPGSTIFYDLEGFSSASAPCRYSALRFLSVWTQRLRAHGYVSGVYSGATSGIRLLDRARRSGARLALPEQIWVADWNGRANTRSKHVSAHGWRDARVKQYRGDHTERHGGVSINIDSNYVDLRVRPGHQTRKPAHARHAVKHRSKRGGSGSTGSTSGGKHAGKHRGKRAGGGSTGSTSGAGKRAGSASTGSTSGAGKRPGGVATGSTSGVGKHAGGVATGSTSGAEHAAERAAQRRVAQFLQRLTAPTVEHVVKHARRHAKRPARKDRWVSLAGGVTPEAERPVQDRLCTTRRINLGSYSSTGSARRVWMHSRLQCLLKQNGLFTHRVDGHWGRRTAYSMHLLQQRTARRTSTVMTRGNWVSLLVAGHHRSWLVRGVRGADVVRVQRALRAVGIRGVYITGRYDGATERGVRAYQRQVRLRPTGTVGRTTWQYLGRGRL